MRLKRRLVIACAVAMSGVALLASPAGAHVDAASAPGSDGATTVTFSFKHGCEGSPTTSLRVQLPSGTTNVKAENPQGWSSEIAGNELKWTGGSVPDGTEAAFVASMKLSAANGETVFLPTIQGCPDSKEQAWLDKGSDPESETAAPRFVVGGTTAAHDDADGHHDSRNRLIIGGAIVVVVAVAVIAVVVVRKRRATT